MGMMREERNPKKSQVWSYVLGRICLCLEPFWKEAWPVKMGPGSMWTLRPTEGGSGRLGVIRREKTKRGM